MRDGKLILTFLYMHLIVSSEKQNLKSCVLILPNADELISHGRL